MFLLTFRESHSHGVRCMATQFFYTFFFVRDFLFFFVHFSRVYSLMVMEAICFRLQSQPQLQLDFMYHLSFAVLINTLPSILYYFYFLVFTMSRIRFFVAVVSVTFFFQECIFSLRLRFKTVFVCWNGFLRCNGDSFTNWPLAPSSKHVAVKPNGMEWETRMKKTKRRFIIPLRYWYPTVVALRWLVLIWWAFIPSSRVLSEPFISIHYKCNLILNLSEELNKTTTTTNYWFFFLS